MWRAMLDLIGPVRQISQQQGGLKTPTWIISHGSYWVWTKTNKTKETNTAGIDEIALQADLLADYFKSQQTPATAFHRVESASTKF